MALSNERIKILKEERLLYRSQRRKNVFWTYKIPPKNYAGWICAVKLIQKRSTEIKKVKDLDQEIKKPSKHFPDGRTDILALRGVVCK